MRCLFLLCFAALPLAAHFQANLLGGAPLSNASPSFSTQSHGLSPTGLWSDTSTPLPTNAWWLNLALGGGTNTVNALPYLIQAHSDGLRFGFTGKVVEPNYIFTYFTENLSFGATNGLPARQVTDYGPLHVRMD